MSTRIDLDGLPVKHRAPNNHLGSRHVQRTSGRSGPVRRYTPGTPQYDQLKTSSFTTEGTRT